MMNPRIKIASRLSALALVPSLFFSALLINRASAAGKEEPTASHAATTVVETPALTAYATDLTKLALQGKLDPVSNREKEIKQIAQILSRDSRNNPVLVGETGFGRSIIIGGLAYRMSVGDAPASLQNKRVFSLNVTALSTHATNVAEVRNRFNNVLAEVKAAHGQVILFVDELPNFAKDNATMAAIADAMTSGDLRLIGAATSESF